MDDKTLNQTPRGSRLHIAIFGRRNAGKSSLINALTNQNIAIVSDTPGTTTDPVYKSMEILPIGPVVLIDTAGIDDIGKLGALRIEKTFAVLAKTDLLLLVVDPSTGIGTHEKDVVNLAREKKVPVIGVLNKIDLYPEVSAEEISALINVPVIQVSALNHKGIYELKMAMIKSAPKDWTSPTILGDLISSGDIVVLVTPIDLAAPKGRLILPQVQTIRDILDNDAMALVVKERELKTALANLKDKPKLVVTDSQAFLKVAADTPNDVLMTSFSILFARYKGNLTTLIEGANAIKNLVPGDRVLVAEACTHHRVEDDIGTVKIPRWLNQIVGGPLDFKWTSGIELPPDLNDYKLVIHCGACMINRKEMLHRIATSEQSGVPIVNYGVLIAYVLGILKRALAPFPEAVYLLND
ncbi:MAG TPA: [FeFe] hydrogenase H-cluster maturation GTPase HydF [Syntrophorhabdaceae bacterium]|nr:[FeFe] hydrogenase H-cluster maturation GTPase HydF [Syntrophorhabdaceae bacterium]HNQ63968.1 [FeFe] hydrogenase H-cluster maturation GTPase HydF [Syntrophorhabdaceae bacterium]HOB69845.1 [FeFe] hydrogenase H-cluster maturation GTPase HydF [Syntrophorhabdaceae bacterium]HPH41442.1 [FeFe] hydrogenase H-cluster maturation GTPase HydF [Syntrophorhabdaceae bacterium]HQG51121.1 [FeFe] hydrogenase H-cluster maturation GTPase HydF [Syntrophorhabdaceae bacterium]